ncbi:hypothetical protein LZ016_14070 [Sphingomonas sp. SM33]|uniref:Uncharacterized protein n=1 Tax=Sphingomonas telluris TaxID=2907998 RepID=A0ABS9VQG5_9SPHN|nr:hypothetical protein [Sphingomonas telluris]MCH8617219.1 hypothetical protein [Sphingomonas telluris]
MIPIKHSSIFRSRWMALVWAAGIIWFAIEVVAPDQVEGNAAENATDITGSPITPADQQALKDAMNGF